jgi:hypothetical protein
MICVRHTTSYPQHTELEDLLDHNAESNPTQRRAEPSIHHTGSVSSRRVSPDKPKQIQREPLPHYIIKLARLGGYLARAHDPSPGNTVV